MKVLNIKHKVFGQIQCVDIKFHQNYISFLDKICVTIERL